MMSQLVFDRSNRKGMAMTFQMSAFIVAVILYYGFHAFDAGASQDTVNNLYLYGLDKLVFLLFFVLFYIGSFLNPTRFAVVLSMILNISLLSISYVTLVVGEANTGIYALNDPWISVTVLSILFTALLVYMRYSLPFFGFGSAAAPKKSTRKKKS